MGLMMGTMSTVPNKYLSTVWPTKMGQGRAVYNQMMSIGMIIWPLPFAQIYNTKNGRNFQDIYVSCGGLFIIGGLFLLLAMKIVDQKLADFGGRVGNTEKVNKVAPVQVEALQERRLSVALPHQKLHVDLHIEDIHTDD